MLVVLGSGLITFLLLYVVPVFEKTYAEANVPLPFVTQVLIAVGALARNTSWWAAAARLSSLSLSFAKRPVRRSHGRPADAGALFGRWLRDMAVLQLMDALNTLMTAGFTLAEALRQTAESVNNRAMRARRAEPACRPSSAANGSAARSTACSDLFPPIVNQLVVVGESTGQLTKATSDICEHLRREIERKTSAAWSARWSRF